MYQMLKLKLGPQDIRGTDKKNRQRVCKRTETFIVYFNQEKSLTYFDKSAGEHLLVNLVLQGKRFLVVVILKATGREGKWVLLIIKDASYIRMVINFGRSSW